MRILLVLNKVEREMSIMSAIREHILALNRDAVVEIIPFDGNFLRSARRFRPNTVMIFPMNSLGIARLLYLLKSYFRCRIVCFRAEGLLDPSSSQSIAAHTGYDQYGVRLIDAEVFWGPGPAKIISERLIQQGKLSSPDRVRVFGYPRLEAYFRDAESSKLTDRFPVLKSFDRSHTVFVVTGFHFANYTQASIVGAGDLDAANRLPYLLSVVEKIKKYRAQWIAAVRFCAQRHPDIVYILKRHPIERREDYLSLSAEPNIVLVGEDVELSDIVSRSGLLLHYGSTVSADAYIAGIPTIYAYSADPELQEWFTSLGWPFTLSTVIEDLAVAVDKFVAGTLGPNDENCVRDVLEWNFNLRPGQDYRPSRQIAELLLQDEPGQTIPIGDTYLWTSLLWYASVKLRQLGRKIAARTTRLAST